jgi:hypothetical protein
MTQLAVKTDIWFETEECYKCGVVFGVPLNLSRTLREQGGDFWCPNGHCQRYTKPENQRLREKLDEQTRIATEQAKRAALAEAEAREAQDKLTNLKKRITKKERTWKPPAKRGKP